MAFRTSATMAAGTAPLTRKLIGRSLRVQGRSEAGGADRRSQRLRHFESVPRPKMEWHGRCLEPETDHHHRQRGRRERVVSVPLQKGLIEM